MRQVVNISLPKATSYFASIGELFRHVRRKIAMRQLLRDVKQSRKEFAAGKGILLKSLKDLR